MLSLACRANHLMYEHMVWYYDVPLRDGQCQEHNADEQVICAVGLARAKPGVFVAAIQYLLVLATPVEVIMPL